MAAGSLDHRFEFDQNRCRGPSDPAFRPLSPFWWARPGWRWDNLSGEHHPSGGQGVGGGGIICPENMKTTSLANA
ncbi:hypothetical protein EVAR_49427_1 [Eumeta japonica]|uniref:Uncharacterized protein n=1 Tax=Eumeta variegata TaxID=151549 RepID=A0A4C1YU98_EUMVA|nr:hypothetical protein EVAR_49427_1 [Eumeta japonica]